MTLTVTTSCRNTTCANGGTCFDLVTGGSYCNCPQGFTGTTCTEGEEIVYEFISIIEHRKNKKLLAIEFCSFNIMS